MSHDKLIERLNWAIENETSFDAPLAKDCKECELANVDNTSANTTRLCQQHYDELSFNKDYATRINNAN